MPAPTAREQRTAPGQRTARAGRRPVSFRIPEPALALLDRAAERTHQDRTSFVIAAAVEKAREILRDQTSFTLSEDDHDRLKAALDDPAPANEALRALARRKPPWSAR